MQVCSQSLQLQVSNLVSHLPPCVLKFLHAQACHSLGIRLVFVQAFATQNIFRTEFRSTPPAMCSLFKVATLKNSLTPHCIRLIVNFCSDEFYSRKNLQIGFFIPILLISTPNGITRIRSNRCRFSVVSINKITVLRI